MSLLQNKIDVTTKFFEEWTETVIHWHGLEFNQPYPEEWIRVEYIPQTKYNTSISSRFDGDSGWIALDIFARKENRTYELFDMINDMLSTARIGNNSIKSVDIQNKDEISTDDGDYRVMTVSVYLQTL